MTIMLWLNGYVQPVFNIFQFVSFSAAKVIIPNQTTFITNKTLLFFNFSRMGAEVIPPCNDPRFYRIMVCHDSRLETLIF